MGLKKHIIGNSLFINGHLIISDLQLGYEEQLHKQGVQIPLKQTKDILQELRGIVKITKPSTIVFNGDIKHEFGRILKTEWRGLDQLLACVPQHTKIVFVQGNHDTILLPMLQKKGYELVDHYVFGDYYCCHGHQIPAAGAIEQVKTIIIGHEHPAIGLREQGRVELYKCFLQGTYKKKELIVMPSFNPLFEGTDILAGKMLSPFLKNIQKYRVIVVADEIMDFGLVGDL